MKGGNGRTVDALQAGLAAEHAAVYGYGVLGARLPATHRRTAFTIWEEHRAARDRLAGLISERGADPVAAAASYPLPVKVTSGRSAAELAAALEDAVVKAYVGLAGAGDRRLRKLAATAMQEAMTLAVRWRGLAGAARDPSAAAASPAPSGLPGRAVSSATGPAAAFPGISPDALSPEPGQ